MNFTWKRFKQGFEFSDCSILVSASVKEKLRLTASMQKRKIGAIDRNAQTNQVRDASVLAAHVQPHPRTKTESCQKERHAGKLLGEKIKRCAHIFLLAHPVVVLAGAQARAAKIESQHGMTQRIERLRGLINHFVVHGPAV